MSIFGEKKMAFLQQFFHTFLATILFFTLGCQKQTTNESKVINLSAWPNYVDPTIIKKFEQETGYTVNISNYSSNEELLAKVQAGASGIDVAIPSDYMVGIMVKLNLLQNIDQSKIANAGLIAPEFLSRPYYPSNQYSLPYGWSTAGIAVNRELFKGSIKSWKDLFTNPELKGKFSLLDDVREVTAAALKMNGHSVNTTKPEELKAAEKILLEAKSNVKMFTSDTIDALINKEVAVAHSYSPDALQAIRNSGGKIEYILPEEGGTTAIDNVVIFKTAQNPEGAHKLINFLLAPESNVNFVKTVMGGPVLKTTRELLPDDLKNNSSLFPSATLLSKYESIVDLGEATQLFDLLWTKIKTE